MKYYIKESVMRECILNSFSYADVIRKLGWDSISGGNYKTIKRYIKKYNIDISHFTGQGWSKGKKITCNFGLDLSEILIENSSYTYSSSLKKKLIKLNLLEYKCCICSISTWLDEPLSLHIDHINGVNDDNRIENLRLLCPNCHTQTPTYAGKNKRKYVSSTTKNKSTKKKSLPSIIKIKEVHQWLCQVCNITITPRHKLCVSCYHNSTKGKPGIAKIQWPTPDEMKTLVWKYPTQQLAKQLGVSDTAIAKYCRNHFISKPPRGYWQKLEASLIRPHLDLNQEPSI